MMELMVVQDEIYRNALYQMNARCGEKDGCGAIKRTNRIEKNEGGGREGRREVV